MRASFASGSALSDDLSDVDSSHGAQGGDERQCRDGEHRQRGADVDEPPQRGGDGELIARRP